LDEMAVRLSRGGYQGSPAKCCRMSFQRRDSTTLALRVT
jgi:hypothetical protein